METNKELKDEREIQEYYRKTINEITDKIKDTWVLEQLFRCARNIAKEDC